MISSLLIANRGEIAVRIIRTCRELGVRSVVVHSTADAGSLPVRMADSAICIGPPLAKDSYLNVPNIIASAVLSRCDAVHPGVGFLAENADFARSVTEAGLIFVGPAAETIDLLGDKIRARATATSLSVPCTPGSGGAVDESTAAEAAGTIGYPVIIKAAAGGGGKGMRIARNEAELLASVPIAKREAKASFADDTVYLEHYFESPRHVEIQLLADGAGNVVSLGERDCTVQKNHQKLIEESPSGALSGEMRTAMETDAVRLFRELKYSGAGTVEFLVAEGRYFFMEVNARVQVEHPVSELRSGIDIIAAQLRIASGDGLGSTAERVVPAGYAMECRINALEAGTVTGFTPPGGFGVRCDTHMETGAMVPPYYDSLIAKVLVSASDRAEGLVRMKRALGELRIEGVRTNRDEQLAILDSPIFRKGEYGTELYRRLFEEKK
jgi:acetyl-CoA carboxylase, biotin carboxylase subunit